MHTATLHRRAPDLEARHPFNFNCKGTDMTDVANPAADPAAAAEATAGGTTARKLNGAKAPKRTKASEPHPAAKPKRRPRRP